MERLTRDITMDILSRLSIRSLIQCTCVCKTWQNIISHPTLYFNQSSSSSTTTPDLFFHCVYYEESGRSYVDRFQVSDFYFSEQQQDDDDDDDIPIIKPDKIVYAPFFINSSKYLNVLGSCNGFLCLSTLWNSPSNYFFPSDPIYVFNPITGEHLELPNFEFQPDCRKIVKFMSGFGVDFLTQEYKLVILLFCKEISSCSDVCESGSVMNEMRVCNLRGLTWRKRMRNVPNVLVEASQVFSYVFVNGCLHWSVIDQNSRLQIVSLHLGNEEFGDIETPDLDMLSGCRLKSDYFAIGVLDESLSLVDSSRAQCVDVWLRKKNINGNEHWIKQYSIQRELMDPYFSSSTVVQPLRYQKNAEILLQGNNSLVAYNAESNTVKFLNVAIERADSLKAFPFVGKLISVRVLCGQWTEQ
ncbi:hypothetical protein AQUCO_01600303v1 [Aquilegia coerulea]|uniref:F-box domain-containing protein n=1 Tax=Aquilegia coerulea TaxID=218851 RepID=A0A2G5DR28_AQUCA|nr:hypothetical protein AQUCO_01600303v1 [Aquilegia coerulea]